MAVLFPQLQFFDNNGNPLALGKVYTYITGTTTPKSTWTTAAESANHPNPVVLDDEGRAEIWLSTDSEYRITIKSATDATIQGPIDNVTGVGIQLSAYGQLASDLDVNGYALISTSNGNVTLSPNGTGDVVVTNDTLKINGSATQSARVVLGEDTDNGANTVTIVAPSTIASDKVQTLQDVTGTIYVSTGTDIPVTDGGTGASDAATARTNLGAAASGANTDLTGVYLNNTGLKVKDTNASHGLSIIPGSDITADRTFTITTGDANRTLTMSADITANSSLTVNSATTISSAGAALIDDADAAAQRATLGLVIGTNVAAPGANTDITSVYLNNTGLKIKDTDASHGLVLKPNSNITADRTLNITTGDSDRSINVFPFAAESLITSGSATSPISITGLTTTTAARQMIITGTIYSSATNDQMNLQTGTGGTPTYTGSGYQGKYIMVNGTTVTGGTQNTTFIDLVGGSLGNKNSSPLVFQMIITATHDGTSFTGGHYSLTSKLINNSSAVEFVTANGTCTDYPGTITAIKITSTSGNLYGRIHVTVE